VLLPNAALAKSARQSLSQICRQAILLISVMEGDRPACEKKTDQIAIDCKSSDFLI
jgi:hypothetical protein